MNVCSQKSVPIQPRRAKFAKMFEKRQKCWPVLLMLMRLGEASAGPNELLQIVKLLALQNLRSCAAHRRRQLLAAAHRRSKYKISKYKTIPTNILN